MASSNGFQRQHLGHHRLCLYSSADARHRIHLDGLLADDPGRGGGKVQVLPTEGNVSALNEAEHREARTLRQREAASLIDEFLARL
jgi:hypothetical protein